VHPQNRGDSRPAPYYEFSIRGTKDNSPLVTGGNRIPAWLVINFLKATGGSYSRW
jgi:hypothetical protein